MLVKVAAINSLYNTNIYATFEMAKHIYDLRIDSDLEACSLDLVDKIAYIVIKGKTWRFYSFATKYCSWHMPNAYPIYNSVVEQMLVWYQKREPFAADFVRGNFREYPRLKYAVEQFRDRYGLSQFNFKQLDKFLWMYGQELIGKED